CSSLLHSVRQVPFILRRRRGYIRRARGMERTGTKRQTRETCAGEVSGRREHVFPERTLVVDFFLSSQSVYSLLLIFATGDVPNFYRLTNSPRQAQSRSVPHFWHHATLHDTL